MPLPSLRHALHRRRRPLRLDAVPPLRPQRPEAAGDLARALAQLRRRPAATRRARAILRRAFDLGVTHIDLANNYGPPYGSAEETFGRVLRDDLRPYRDELVISTKAGYDMWPGPYGEWGSRKYVLASLDQSLARMGLEYVDIFYSHRFDPETPLEETMGALDTAVRSGRALYAGISSYSPEQTQEAYEILEALGTPLLIHQPSYSMLNRWIEPELLDTLGELGVGCIGFSPLAQGMLTDEVPERHPRGLARAAELVALARPAQRAVAREDPRAERDRAAPRPVARADGARVDAARRADDLDADRRRRASRSSRTRSARSTTCRSPTTSSRRSTSTRPTATSTSGRARQRSSRISNWRSGIVAAQGGERRARDVALRHVHVAERRPAREQRGRGRPRRVRLRAAGRSPPLDEHRAAVHLEPLVVRRQRPVGALPRQAVLAERAPGRLAVPRPPARRAAIHTSSTASARSRATRRA